jgi:glycosyltransferase involved in cell wall biosynthesis
MKIALISTVFNEGDDIFAWANSLRTQTHQPDEFVIVDGGSTDGTPERLREAFSTCDFPAPKIIVEKCNIARGRNLAIQNTSAEIIAVTDAGSFPETKWLNEITKPLLANENIEVCGGCSQPLVQNSFQQLLMKLEGLQSEPQTDLEVYPSSRNTAFRRQAWKDVGGYPEWLTLTAEDALFNFQLHRLKKIFSYNPHAIVRWPVRENASDYFKMLYQYGYGAAEAKLYAPYFWRRTFIAFFPPLLLLSRWRWRYLIFRYRKNFASARGWTAGWVKGKSAPKNWKRNSGIFLSPEAQIFFQLNKHSD